MWFATYDGINRYDGHNFSVYHFDRDPDFVQVAGSDPLVFVDSNNRIWAYDGGVGLYDREEDKFSLCNGVLNGPVTDMDGHPNGNLLLATGGRVVEIDPLTKGVAANAHDFSSCGKVVSLACKHGILALGTGDNHLFIYRSEDYTLVEDIDFSLPDSSQDCEISDILIINAREIWAVVSGRGLFKIDTYNRSLESYECPRNEGGRSYFAKLRANSDNEVYLLQFTGIYRFREGKYTFDPFGFNAVAKNIIKDVYFDSDGIWIGTYHSGSFYACLKEIPVRPVNLGIPPEEMLVCSIFENKDGKIWISTQDCDILIYNPDDGKVEKFRSTFFPSYVRNGVSAIVFDDEREKIYFGNNSGFTVYDQKRKRDYNINPDGSDAPWIFSMVREDSDRLWVGSLSGLYIFDMEKEELSRVPGTEDFFTYKLLRDNRGYMWIGTDKCLIRSKIVNDGKTLRCDEFTTMSGAVDVHDIMLLDTNLYVAARNGLFVLDKEGNGRHYTREDGLSSNYLNGIECDNSGKIWIGTEYGLNCLNPQTGEILRYYASDGTGVDYFTKNSHCSTSAGLLYFGGVAGLCSVDTKMGKRSICSENPRVSSVYVNDIKRETHKEMLVLKHFENTLRFEFSVPNYSSFGKSIIYFRLNGVNRDWQSASSDNTATYAELRPGRYTLEMYSTNKDSVTSPSVTSFCFTVLKPWYSSAVAIAIYIFLSLFLITVIIYYIVQHYRNKAYREIGEIRRLAKGEIDSLRLTNVLGGVYRPEDVPFLVRLLDIIESNISDASFGVERLSYEMCMSRSNLFLKVREASGESVSRIIRTVRFNKACKMLAETDASMDAIATDLGYSTGASFSAAFKKEFGMPPVEWRAKNK